MYRKYENGYCSCMPNSSHELICYRCGRIVKERFPAGFLPEGEIDDMHCAGKGHVFRISDQNQQYSLKIAEVEHDQFQTIGKRESGILKRLEGCPNTVKLIRATEITAGTDRRVYECLLEEYAVPLVLVKRMSGTDIIRLSMDICKAMLQCKSRGILHLDIKPGNILIDDNGNGLLCDFNTAENLEDLDKIHTTCGTLAYLAPEAYQRKKYSEASDIYSLGITMYAMLNGGRLPFTEYGFADQETGVYKRLAGTPLPLPAGLAVSEAAIQLIALLKKMCAYDPIERIKSFEECLEELNKTAEASFYEPIQMNWDNEITTVHLISDKSTVPPFHRPDINVTAQDVHIEAAKGPEDT